MSTDDRDRLRLQSKEEAARFLGVSRATVDRLRSAGSLPYVRVGNQVRFLPEDLADYVQSRRSGGTAACVEEGRR